MMALVLFGFQPRPQWMPMAYGRGVDLARNLRNTLFTDGDKVFVCIAIHHGSCYLM
jgi:hypothetical protein